MVPGYGNGVLDVAVLEVKLAGTQVREGIPALDVVIDAHARVPLRDFVNHAVLGFQRPHAVGAILGDFEGKTEVDLDHVTVGFQRLVQAYLHPRVIDIELRNLCLVFALLHGDGGSFIATLEARVAEASARNRRSFAAARSVTKRVLVELQPEEFQVTGAVVLVGDFNISH